MIMLLKTLISIHPSCHIHGICRNYAAKTIPAASAFNASKIPNRVHRSEIDILNALSLTVGTDPTAAHYKYHDDPYLIPTSNSTKRTFAMAQEAGRKAAKWIRQKHTPLFQHKNADPPIDAYFPVAVYTDDTTDLSENTLTQLIENANVSDTILVYELLAKKNIPISEATKRKLFGLVCFFNEEDQLAEDLIEERWFSQAAIGKERLRKTWKDSGLAEQLFIQLTPKDSFAYCTMISGMCKFYQVERAFALYQEAIEHSIKIDANTFNAILQVVHFIKESGDLRWELAQELLQTMAQKRVKPNLGTLNATLSAIGTITGNRQTRSMALKTLAEFKALDIMPSLATWYHLLVIFCRNRGPPSNILVDILNEIADQEFKSTDPKDVQFFVTAMDVCRHNLNDVNVARRIDKLLHFKNNYDLIGNSYQESVYYRHYFAVLVANEPLDKFIETYNRLVPNVYTPEPGIMAEILKFIEINGAIEYMPQLWSDMVIFDHINREPLVTQAIRLLVDNRPNVTIPMHTGLDEKFGHIGWQIWEKIENQPASKTSQLAWTAGFLGDVLTLCCRSGDADKSVAIFEKLCDDQSRIPGTPRSIAMDSYIRLCIETKQPTRAIDALQYCVENGFTTNYCLGKTIADSLTLSDGQLSKITSLVGKKVMNGVAESESADAAL